MQNTSRTLLPVLSDTHGGHKLGLMNPDVTLFDETETGELLPYQPKPTASQEYLWALYKEHLWQVQNLARGDALVFIHNGDICQGNRYMSQLVSTRMADQILIGVANLAPILDDLNAALRLSIGTEAHVFGEGSAEILVADTLKARFPDQDVQVCHHGLAEIGGIWVDYAHHGPFTGSRAWLSGNVARYYLQSLMMEEIMAGRTPPRLVLRAHYHNWCCETVTISCGDRDYVSTLLVTPAYCMLGEFGVRATRSRSSVTNGMAVVEIEDGDIKKIHRLTKTMDIRSREKL